jgi:hypothetical protein
MQNLRRIIGTAVCVAAAGLALSTTEASADQHGTNYCVSGVFAVHQTPSMDSPVLDNIAATQVWHHYSTDGNWSMGYIRGTAEGSRGYIPLGALTHDLGNASGATTCPY